MAELDPEVLAYYERGEEVHRLSGGMPSGPLELARTKEILLRHLPPPPLEILDVGGGPGVHAVWLAERGDHVHVVEPVPLHIEQASAAHPRITAELGDARQLSGDNDSVDAVLLMGPLYHLEELADRRAALAEALRVLQPRGHLFAAAISRFAALFDILVRLNRLHEPEVLRIVEESVKTGRFNGPGEAGLFTKAYFHLPRELLHEVTRAGFERAEVLSVEGPGYLVPGLDTEWSDPLRREALLSAARLVESEPELLAASSHLLCVAKAPEA